MNTPQRLDTFQMRDEDQRIGVWLIQPDGRVVFVSRAMWNWIQEVSK